MGGRERTTRRFSLCLKLIMSQTGETFVNPMRDDALFPRFVFLNSFLNCTDEHFRWILVILYLYAGLKKSLFVRREIIYLYVFFKKKECTV
jgi:hypothetical protein